MADTWTVHAVKYAERNSRTRADSFIFDDHPAAPHGMDYFVWLLDDGRRRIVVDTGYDTAEAARRDRPILRDPVQALGALGVEAETVDTVIITHLHYDHAGGLDRYPNATFHLQAAEMAFATGPCMCHDTLQMPFTVDHVCQMVRHVYSGRVVFHDGAGEVAPGVRVHCVGGHSRGLQVVEVMTDHGPLCLASDATHYYENFLSGKPFPIVVDTAEMLAGFDTLVRLGRGADRVIPGHDPLVRDLFPRHERVDFAWRLDMGPKRPVTG
ncbi:N-acyl homoserine lactonase family protein [Thalassococcus sp. CAU 1522]|uniref:N-acyl homoserine lactonase family protein n=1 Tax=Thalassococcus arenae TaxID=2851652 RepID=A0ABS6ND60_9RHOB|nr:N-acyl homoserine lactonase family protein [Thalassococcus arenae]MBV2361622.1 N-acyl homoserine lactonase family protein [Thalassococcus arenae]